MVLSGPHNHVFVDIVEAFAEGMPSSNMLMIVKFLVAADRKKEIIPFVKR